MTRARGALLGLAVGDAVGTTLEFKPRDTYPLLTDMVGGGPFGLKPGEWTDDTAMALALADSLIANDGLDEADLMAGSSTGTRTGPTRAPAVASTSASRRRSRACRGGRSTGDPQAGATAPDTGR